MGEVERERKMCQTEREKGERFKERKKVREE